MRRRGWDLTESQVTRGVTGIAAPVFDNRGRILGSLSLTIGRTKIPASEAAADRRAGDVLRPHRQHGAPQALAEY